MMPAVGGHAPRCREVGMGPLTGQVSPGQPWTAFITQEYAFSNSDKPFVTGVVYNDNGDQICRDGEGQGNQTVTLSHASGFSISTQTASAGGYCFEVLVPGTYTITVNGQSTQVTVGADNMKVDSRSGTFLEPYVRVEGNYDFALTDADGSDEDRLFMRAGAGVSLYSGPSISGGIEADSTAFLENRRETTVSATVRVAF